MPIRPASEKRDGPTGAADDAEVTAGAADEEDGQSFFRWSLGIYLAVTAVLVAVPMVRMHGTYVYVLDDPAIHLAVAQNLIHHGTWGVSPGHYESASSSPAWTVLLAILLVPFGKFREALPLIGNLVFGALLLQVLSRWPVPLRPSWRRPGQVLGVFLLVTAVLFLPGLAVVGMEHSMHALLVVVAVWLFVRRDRGEPTWGPAWLPYVVLALAMLTRFETAFVALGLGLGILLGSRPQWSSGVVRNLSTRVRQVVLVGLASGLPLVAYGLFNHAMGQGLLPNSVLYKSQATGLGANAFALDSMLARFFQDPLLPVIWVAAMLYLLLCRPGRNRAAIEASVLAVAIPLHVIFAQIGWYERYQSYLIVLGVAFACSAAAERWALPGRRLPIARRAAALALAVLLLAIPFTHMKVLWTYNAPGSSVDMYRQHYLGGKFLARYYDGQPVATGELGYISLFHKGSVTDLNGLGDYQVLRYLQEDRDSRQYLDELARDRGFDVVAVYPITFGLRVPAHWILVATWVYEGKKYTAVDRTFQFWATTPEAVGPLIKNLQDFQADLPPEEHLVIQDLAEYRAAVQLDKKKAGN